MKKIGILQFPGSNCDRDVFKALKNRRPEFLPASQPIEIKNYKAFIVPGGFSYGDYLRAGALAAVSPAMRDIIQSARKGWPILGICNGFQILCEAGLLEGVLLANKSGRFIEGWAGLKLENQSSFWPAKTHFKLPIAHGEGSYYIPDEGLKKLQDNNQIWLSYKNNPNGSKAHIAGVMSKKGHVAGLMPHPERAVAPWMGGEQGLPFFQNL